MIFEKLSHVFTLNNLTCEKPIVLFVLYLPEIYKKIIQNSFQAYPAYGSLPETKSWAEVALTPDPTAGAVLRNVTQMVEEVQEALRRLSAICKTKFLHKLLFNRSFTYTFIAVPNSNDFFP